MRVEFFTINDELWFRDDKESKRLSVGTDIIRVIYDKIAEFYPDALKALNKEYARLMDEGYKRFRIVNRFLKCNFGIIDKTLDLNERGEFKFECVPCPLRGECKLENVVCSPKFDSRISDAEMRVLQYVYRNRDREYIADKLCLSEHTVNNHIKNAYARIGVHSQAEFIEYATRNHLFTDDQGY